MEFVVNDENVGDDRFIFTLVDIILYVCRIELNVDNENCSSVLYDISSVLNNFVCVNSVLYELAYWLVVEYRNVDKLFIRESELI